MSQRICIICDIEIQLKQQCLRIDIGMFKKDDFSGINFERLKSSFGTLGYTHFKCINGKKIEGE